MLSLFNATPVNDPVVDGKLTMNVGVLTEEVISLFMLIVFA